MRIFKVDTDINYQWLGPVNTDADNLLDLLTFSCEAKDASWTDLKWYIINPMSKAANFIYLNSGCLIFDERVYQSDLFTFLEMAGQILPIKVEGEKKYVLNVLQCINNLDQEKSTFDYYSNGTKGRILTYSFHRRLCESTIFKIPETCRAEILTYCDVKDSEDEFYYLYKRLKFSGLYFTELFKA